jgi:DNA polymerase-3 subunit gamma/tau
MRDALSMFDKAVSFCGQTLEYRNVAQTLNVLDYDTYFKMTELLLAGNYVDALLLFDQVLSNGFSGQIFMAGLNQHLRDLLVAKGPAISLIEFTGTLLERYRAQAANCDPGFLFGAISVLTDADGKIRQSSNQRLLVELGLMKIAALGQKKNEPTAIADSYPLPELLKGIPTPATAPQPVAQSVVVPTAAEVKPTVAEPKSVVAEPKPSSAPAPAPEQVVTPAAAVEPDKVVEQPQQPKAKPSSAANATLSTLSGTSISSLLRGSYGAVEEAVTEEPSTADDKRIDPQTEAKLTAAREAIIDEIKRERPRFIVGFETMEFYGCKIKLTVPSEALRHDILHAATELLFKIADIAGVKGALEFDIAVKEDEVRKMRPIKLEDRMEHIEKRNPLYLEFKAALDLDVE